MAYSRILRFAGLAAILVCLPVARAAAPEQLLPADSEIVVTINVKQILDTPLVKKHVIAAAKEALKSADEANQILEELGFDPFTDIDRITVAGPGGAEQDRGLVIARGRFDVDKFKARAEKAAQDEPDHLKIRKAAGGIIYEVSPPGESKSFFVALLNKRTLIASPGKDYIVEAMKKEAAKDKPAIKDKDFQAVLDRLDGKQSLAFAANSAAFKGADLGPATEFLGKIDALGGGLTLSDELKFDVVVSTKSEEDAKKIKDTVNTAINSGIALLGLTAGEHKEIEKILDILKTVKATAKGKTVTLKVNIGSDVLESLTEKDDK